MPSPRIDAGECSPNSRSRDCIHRVSRTRERRDPPADRFHRLRVDCDCVTVGRVCSLRSIPQQSGIPSDEMGGLSSSRFTWDPSASCSTLCPTRNRPRNARAIHSAPVETTRRIDGSLCCRRRNRDHSCGGGNRVPRLTNVDRPDPRVHLGIPARAAGVSIAVHARHDGGNIRTEREADVPPRVSLNELDDVRNGSL